MISDLFPLNRRATALAIYALGIPAGSMLGSLAGGWLNEAFDWRTAFIVVGAPGVLLAIFVRLTLREPVRGASETTPINDAPAPPTQTFSVISGRVRLPLPSSAHPCTRSSLRGDY
jgi:MFS family permease